MVTTWMVRFFIISIIVIANTKADTAQPQTVSLNPSKNTTINVSIQGDDVIARNMHTDQQTTLASIPNLPAYARDLWVEDFNFDGVHDIAISTGTNDAGLNQTYSIFTWSLATQALIPLALGSPLSNIEKINYNKELRSSYKAGDFWREDSYRFSRNTAYLYSRANLISINVWHTELFDKKHQRVKSFLSKNGRNRQPRSPLIGHISINNTAIHSDPLPSSSHDIYLSKGQPVQLLDFKKNQDGIHWFYIRANVDTPAVEGWIPLNNIDL